MDEPTDLFNPYEHDFNQLINDVKQKLDSHPTGKVGLSNYLYIDDERADWSWGDRMCRKAKLR